MTVSERVKLLLGNLHVALMEKETRIEELEAQIKDLEGLLKQYNPKTDPVPGLPGPNQHERAHTHMASP